MGRKRRSTNIGTNGIPDTDRCPSSYFDRDDEAPPSREGVTYVRKIVEASGADKRRRSMRYLFVALPDLKCRAELPPSIAEIDRYLALRERLKWNAYRTKNGYLRIRLSI